MANELKVNISADMTAFDKAMAGLEKSLDNAAKRMDKVGRSLTKNLSAPLAAAGVAATALAVRAGNVADKLLDLESTTGLTTDQLQRYRHVTTIAGVSTDAMADAAEKMTRQLGSMTGEGSPAARVLNQLGVEAKDASGELRAGNEIFEESIMALASMENTTERNALATQLFGGSWKDLSPILDMGADGIENVMKEADKLGLVMGRDSLEASNKFRQEWQTLMQQIDAMTLKLGNELAPLFSNVIIPIFQNHLVPAIQSAINVVSKLIAWFSDLNPVMQKIIIAVTGILTILGPMLVILGKVILAVKALTLAGLAMSLAFIKITAIVVALVAVIAGIVAIVRAVIAAWDVLVPFFRQLWMKIEIFFLKGVDAILKPLRSVLKVIGVELDGFGDKIEEKQRILEAEPKVGLGDVVSKMTESVANDIDMVTSLFKTGEGEVVESTDNMGKGTTDFTETALENFETVGGGIEELADKFEDSSERIQNSINNAAIAGQHMGWSIVELDEITNEPIENMNAKMKQMEASFVQAQENIGDSFIKTADQQLESAESFHEAANAIGKSVQKSIGAAISEGIAFLVAGSLKANAALGPLAIPIASAAGIAGKALFNAMIPKFAGGGAVFGETLAIMGDYPGASTNPEFAMRYDQVEGLLDKAMNQAGNGSQRDIEFIIAGNNLKALLNRNENLKKRSGN